MKERLELIGKMIMNAIRTQDVELSSDIPLVVTVKRKDGEYRRQGVGVGWAFFDAGIYVGSRGKLILCFESPDFIVSDWQHIEVTPEQFDDLFPMAVFEIDKVLETGAESLPALIENLMVQESRRKVTEEEEDEQRVKTLPNYGLF